MKVDTSQTKPLIKEILIVEDSKIIQNILRRGFSLTGDYKITSVSNGKEALKVIKEKKEPFNAIFLDLHMPFMDGIETIKRIRAFPDKKSKTVVIAATGNNADLSEEEFKALGFNGGVIKPFDFQNIFDLLKKVNDPMADEWLGLMTGEDNKMF